jgi:hypothetical protein
MNLDDVPDDVLFTILSFLDAQSLSRCKSVSKRWHTIALSDVLWKRLCWFDWRLCHARAPPTLSLDLSQSAANSHRLSLPGEACSSFWHAYISWNAMFHQSAGVFRIASTEEEGELLARFGRCWQIIEDTQRTYDVDFKLRPGVDVARYEEQLRRLPFEYRALIAFHNGQDSPEDDIAVPLFGSFELFVNFLAFQSHGVIWRNVSAVDPPRLRD